MCDIMLVALSVDARQAPGGSETGAAAELFALIGAAGLGHRPIVREPIDGAIATKGARLSLEYLRMIGERVESLVAGSPGRVISFELTSSPKDFCICDATSNNCSPPDAHPERAPIIGLLRSLLTKSFLLNAAFFYGPSYVEEFDRVRSDPPSSETAA